MELKKIILTVLIQAILLGSFDTIYGTEEAVYTQQNYPLIEATKSGNLRETLSLLKKNADPNQTDAQGRTPLMFAVKQKGWIAPGMISKLLQSGAKLDTQDQEGKTAFVYAIRANKPQAVRQLLSKGASTELPASLAIPEKIKKIIAQHHDRQTKLQTTTIDPISGENIFNLDPAERIMVGKNTYKKESLLKHILSKIALQSIEEIKDPVSQVPLERAVVKEVASHFNIPMTELENGTKLTELQTLEEYLKEKYAFSDDESESESDYESDYEQQAMPIRSREPRKRVFEGERPAKKSSKTRLEFFETLLQQPLLQEFSEMIKNDGLIELQYRLNQKNNELLKDLSENERVQVEVEVKILNQAIERRIENFKKQKSIPKKTKKDEAPFIYGLGE